MKVFSRCLVSTLYFLGLVCVAPLAAAATYVVDTTLDNVTALYTQCTAAPGNCSLRGAVQRANTNPGADVIEFSVPVVDDPNCNSVSGICKFNLTQVPLLITDEVTMNGYTQSGALPNTILASVGEINSVLKIEINNAAVQSSKSMVVKGLIFTENGLRVQTGSPTEALNLTVQGCWFSVDGNELLVNAGGLSYIVGNAGPGFIHQLQIGGLLPAERNWFAAGNVNIDSNAAFNQTPTFQYKVEGNLFGTKKNAMEASGSVPYRFYTGLAYRALQGPSSLVIGGTDPNARNIFANLNVGVAGGGANDVITPLGKVRIIGNYFGVGKDGVTAIPNVRSVYVEGTEVGGFAANESNLFVGGPLTNATQSDGTVSTGRMRSIGNRYRSHKSCAQCSSPEEGETVMQPNDPGDPDGYGFYGGTKQNFPEISAVSQNGNQLTITYRVDTAAANATYPLDIEFYKGVKWEGEEILGRDVYSTAQTDRTVTLTIPAGISFGADDVVLATANAAAPAGGASRFSWYPSVLTLIGNAPGYVGVPMPVRVRMQSIGGVYLPRGDVVISPEVLGAVGCTATLQATAFPSVSEGTCNILFTRADDVGPNKILRASYAVQGLPYAGEDGRGISISRNITVLTNDFFCHGFEDNSTGSCRPLP
jgi:hypothetical protein